MNVRTNWMTNNALYGADYPNDALTILQARERYEAQRDYSSEGCSGTIDGIQTSFVIQEHTNPINKLRGTKKIFSNYDFNIKTGSLIVASTPVSCGEFLVISEIEDLQSYKKSLVMTINNMLKFYDSEGILHQIPCVIYSDSYYDLESNKYIEIQKNQLTVLCQLNEESSLIKWSDLSSDVKSTRFIINGIPYSTIALNPHRYTINGVGCLLVNLKVDQIKESDDLINNIADNDISIIVDIQNGDTLSIGEAQTVQLNTLVTVNGVEVDSPVITYLSSDETIATVDSNGLVTTIASGNATISATYSTAVDSIDLTVTPVSADNYTVDISSSNGVLDYIKLSQSLTYTANSLNNGQSYTISGDWYLLESDGVTPLSSSIISIVSEVDNVIKIKATSNDDYEDYEFKLKYADANAEKVLDITITGLF